MTCQGQRGPWRVRGRASQFGTCIRCLSWGFRQVIRGLFYVAEMQASDSVGLSGRFVETSFRYTS